MSYKKFLALPIITVCYYYRY